MEMHGGVEDGHACAWGRNEKRKYARKCIGK